jgi:hypothetical protein
MGESQAPPLRQSLRLYLRAHSLTSPPISGVGEFLKVAVTVDIASPVTSLWVSMATAKITTCSTLLSGQMLKDGWPLASLRLLIWYEFKDPLLDQICALENLSISANSRCAGL